MPAAALASPIASARNRTESRGILLTLRQQTDRDFIAAVPAELRGRWCRTTVKLPPAVRACVVRFCLAAPDAEGPELILPVSRWPRTATRSAITFVPPETRSLRLTLFGDSVAAAPTLSVDPVSYSTVVLGFCRRHPMRIARAVIRSALRQPGKMLGLLRRDLGCMAVQSSPRIPYAWWIEACDRWPQRALDGLLRSPRRLAWPSIAAFVVRTENTLPEALEASLSAVKASPVGLTCRSVGGGQSLSQVLATTSADYIALVQAGEILPAHALPLLADQAVTLGYPDILYADEDESDRGGRRHSPVFKPQPSRMLMLSGSMCRGVWLIRRGLLAGVSPSAGAWAETARLDAWLRLYEAGRAQRSHRVPHILCHRSAWAEKAPSAALAAIARQHLQRSRFPATISVSDPLRVRVAVPRHDRPKVSIIVPSSCRAPHVATCLEAVLARTDYANFEVILVVAGPHSPDQRQSRTLARLTSDRRVRSLVLDMPAFNYAAVNNAAACEAEGNFLCLLNDDVAPLAPHWLAAMVGHMADPHIAVVGAKLLYPDHTIQHVGITLLPDGTGVHAHRFLSRADPGHGGRAVLSQEVSAVTGACLLTSRDVFCRFGGLDESFASAFNDVDFCLRVRSAGFGVMFSAEAELIHYESLSYGRHYAANEDARAAADRDRMYARWGRMCQDDPFHNPNLARHAGSHAQLAFPPRTDVSFRSGASWVDPHVALPHNGRDVPASGLPTPAPAKMAAPVRAKEPVPETT